MADSAEGLSARRRPRFSWHGGGGRGAFDSRQRRDFLSYCTSAHKQTYGFNDQGTGELKWMPSNAMPTSNANRRLT